MTNTINDLKKFMAKGIDRSINDMSAPDRYKRFCADIPDFDGKSDYSNKYALIAGIGDYSKDWGIILLSYPLPFHSNIIDAYLTGPGKGLKDVNVLGGGKIDISLDKITNKLVIKTYDKSCDFGPVKSKLAVKTCLDSFIDDNFYVWSLNGGNVVYNIT